MRRRIEITSESHIAISRQVSVSIIVLMMMAFTGLSCTDCSAAENGGYRTPTGKIMHAKYDSDRKKGDKLGNESSVSRYRYEKRGTTYNWTFVVRCTDPYIADCAATAVENIVRNPYFGFKSYKHTSQASVSKRASVYYAVKSEVGDNPSKDDLKKIKNIRKYADTSCTPTVLAGYWLYYNMDTQLNMKWIKGYRKKTYGYYCGAVNVEAHQLERAIRQVNKEYVSMGKAAPFKIIYVSKKKRASFFSRKNMKKNLRRGDILCCNPKVMKEGHTAMVQ